ncbi:helix-turn-helix domain-containing protein [Bauldia sp.]|uniref:AraC family transcriptional regulator n=1 Tax=Bauldia sp. TaxID=2575872 RepID=UPI003BABBB89
MAGDCIDDQDRAVEGFEKVSHTIPAALAGSVLRIAGYRETAGAITHQTETASLLVPLIVSFAAPFEIGLGRQPTADDRFSSFTAGLYGGPVRIRSRGEACCLQIDFTPLAAYRFFGLPMRLLRDRMVHLDDLGDAGVSGLARRLADTRTWRQRFAITEAFVADRLNRGATPSPGVAWGYRQLVGTGGRMPISALAESVGWSRKHLAARFREEVGASPKTVARIARFNRAVAVARSDTAGGWADVAAACGYADQAHLVREFGTFAGATPAAWRAVA